MNALPTRAATGRQGVHPWSSDPGRSATMMVQPDVDIDPAKYGKVSMAGTVYSAAVVNAEGSA